MHLSEYFLAVLHHWWPLMSCAAFTILAILVELKQKTSRWAMKISLGLAVSFLLFASYQAWNDEYEKTHPGLRLAIDVIATARRSENAQTATIVVLASISNVGSPSIADQWTLEMIPVSGDHVTMDPSMIHQDKPFVFSYDSGQSVSYSPSDALYLKTPSAPLITGAKDTGFLIFDPPKITQPQAETTGTVYRLSCLDVFGNKVWADYTMKGGHWRAMPYLPGITEPTVK
jgi:hypothetical protein